MGVLCGNLPVVYKALKGLLVKMNTVTQALSQEHILLRHKDGSRISPAESQEQDIHTGEWVRLKGGETYMEVV